MIEISLIIEDSVVPTISQLLLCALGAIKSAQKLEAGSSTNKTCGQIPASAATVTAAATATTITTDAHSSSKHKDSSKSRESKSTSTASSFKYANQSSASTSVSLASYQTNLEDNLKLNKFIRKELLSKFMRLYLLETNQTNVRWIVHTLFYSIYKNSSSINQDQLFELMLEL